MSLQVSHTDDVVVIAPILSVLRDSIPKDLFDARLLRALQNGYKVLIAKDDDRTLGCLGYRMSFDVFWGKTLYIDDLVVRPDIRSQGVGAALLDAAKNLAKDCDHIRLCSGLSRADAHRFYKQNGFSKSSLQFSYSVQNGDA